MDQKDWHRLAQARAKATGLSSTDWQAVIESGVRSLGLFGVNDRVLEQIAEACARPELFNLIVRLTYQNARNHSMGAKVLQRLVEACQLTPYPLSEWVESVEICHTYLKQDKQPTDLHRILGYLNCCAEFPDVKKGDRAFTDYVKEAIKTYGMKRLDNY